MAGANDVAKKAGTKSDVVQDVLNAIVEITKSGEDVNIKGFGTFSKKHKEARNGRNPQTGAAIQIEAKDVFSFKASKSIDFTATVAPTSNRRR
jgi:nucleoid DNA-binding protein